VRKLFEAVVDVRAIDASPQPFSSLRRPSKADPDLEVKWESRSIAIPFSPSFISPHSPCISNTLTMDSSIPQKRPSSPLIPTDPVPSSSSKELQDATSDPTIKGFKVPKQFRNWEGQPKVARVMGGLEASYLDTKLEVDDSNECTSRSILYPIEWRR